MIHYYHLLFDAHEIVDAQGAFAESLLLQKMAIRSMDATPLRRLIVRQLGNDRAVPPACTIALGRQP